MLYRVESSCVRYSRSSALSSTISTSDLINLGKPDGVETTLDLVTEPEFKAVEKLAMRLKDYGAGAIALACTGMSTAGVAKPLAKKTGLPVIDPVTAEGLMAYYECLSK